MTNYVIEYADANGLRHEEIRGADREHAIQRWTLKHRGQTVRLLGVFEDN
jgi:hypothetical protein